MRYGLCLLALLSLAACEGSKDPASPPISVVQACSQKEQSLPPNVTVNAVNKCDSPDPPAIILAPIPVAPVE